MARGGALAAAAAVRVEERDAVRCGGRKLRHRCELGGFRAAVPAALHLLLAWDVRGAGGRARVSRAELQQAVPELPAAGPRCPPQQAEQEHNARSRPTSRISWESNRQKNGHQYNND